MSIKIKKTQTKINAKIKIKVVADNDTPAGDKEAADKEVPEWWGSMSDEQQDTYVKEHPTSTMKEKLHKHIKKAADKVTDTAKDIHKSQKEFFARGDDKPGSKERRGFGQFVKDKAKGLVKAAKHEVKEWKDAGIAIGKLATGKKISHHEKDALKTVAIHAAMTIIPMAITGGLSVGLSNAAPTIATHFLEHSLVMTAGKVALFASADDDKGVDDDVDKTDDLMEHMLNKFGDYIADADIDWKAVFADGEAGESGEDTKEESSTKTIRSIHVKSSIIHGNSSRVADSTGSDSLAKDKRDKNEVSAFQVKTIPLTKVSLLEKETRALPAQIAEVCVQRLQKWASDQNTKSGKDIAKTLTLKMSTTVNDLVDAAVKKYETDKGWRTRVRDPEFTQKAVAAFMKEQLCAYIERLFPHALRGYPQ